MAKSNFKKMTSIKDTEGGNFGHYKEYNGGGSPKGGVWGGTNGRVGWSKRQSMGEVGANESRKDQPRTSDGKFTYNSVNGKETEYEARGKTVNPLLTGGVNGVKISNVKRQFANKQGIFYDKYKDKWFQKGSILITKEGRKYKRQISAHDVWEIARVSFNLKDDAFTFEKENFDETKKGRISKEEKAGISQAKKSKGETIVKTPSGGQFIKRGTTPDAGLTTGIKFNLYPQVLSKLRSMRQLRNTMGNTLTNSAILGSGAAAKSAQTQLLGGKKANLAVNPSVLSNLGNIVTKYAATPVQTVQKAQAGAAKPKFNLAGLLKK